MAAMKANRAVGRTSPRLSRARIDYNLERKPLRVGIAADHATVGDEADRANHRWADRRWMAASLIVLIFGSLLAVGATLIWTFAGAMENYFSSPLSDSLGP